MAKSKFKVAFTGNTEPSPYKIESGIQISGSYRNPDSWKKYPFGDMKVGDSFAIPQDDDDGKPHRVAHAVGVYNQVHKTKLHYASRKQADGSRRFWRVK
jgi:hypothetical protein